MATAPGTPQILNLAELAVLRGRSGRRPGKQPGAQSPALRQSGHPDDTVECGPAACRCCGAGLAGEPAAGVVRRQVFDARR